MNMDKLEAESEAPASVSAYIAQSLLRKIHSSCFLSAGFFYIAREGDEIIGCQVFTQF
jgi:hypothetical protein